VGVGSFAVSAAACYTLLVGSLLVFQQLEPSDRDARELLAYGVIAATILVGGVLLVALPLFAQARWRTNAILAIAVAGLLAALTAPLLIAMISITNGCGLHVGVPVEGPCSS